MTFVCRFDIFVRHHSPLSRPNIEGGGAVRRCADAPGVRATLAPASMARHHQRAPFGGNQLHLPSSVPLLMAQAL
eukprot:scaffold163549_cov31-Tisochrysis_lutea.AAC.1